MFGESVPSVGAILLLLYPLPTGCQSAFKCHRGQSSSVPSRTTSRVGRSSSHALGVSEPPDPLSSSSLLLCELSSWRLLLLFNRIFFIVLVVNLIRRVFDLLWCMVASRELVFSELVLLPSETGVLLQLGRLIDFARMPNHFWRGPIVQRRPMAAVTIHIQQRSWLQHTLLIGTAAFRATAHRSSPLSPASPFLDVKLLVSLLWPFVEGQGRFHGRLLEVISAPRTSRISATMWLRGVTDWGF